MTRTTFKEKSMKKRSLVIKEASNRQHQTQGRPNYTHNPPTNFPQHQTHWKGGCTWLFTKQLRIYATFGQNAACICGFWPKNCMYMQLLAKNMHMYVTFGQKPTYTEKTVVKSRPRVKPIKGSVNAWTYYKMQHKSKVKQRTSQEYQAHCDPKQKQIISPVESAILLWRNIPMAWGTTIDSLTP